MPGLCLAAERSRVMTTHATVALVALLVLAWPFPISVIVLDGLALGVTITTALAALPVLPWYWLLACTMDWLRRKIPEN